MLSPVLTSFSIDPSMRQAIEAHILDALFKSFESLSPPKRSKKGIPEITVTQAKDRLMDALPQYRAIIGKSLPAEFSNSRAKAVDMGNHLHEWIEKASVFFRREGGEIIREGLRKSTQDDFFQHVWTGLFTRKLRSEVESSGLIGDEGGVEKCDLLIESLKQWTKHVCSHIWGSAVDDFIPSAYFLDNETPISQEISYKGSKILLRGKPDAIFLDPKSSDIHVWEYKFGRQGQIELQIAQVILYINLIEAAKGCTCAGGTLCVFGLTSGPVSEPQSAGSPHEEYPDESFDPKIEKAFEGFIGNEQAVYRLKHSLAAKLKNKDAHEGVNYMFCGPGGLGKTELARRMADALETPLLNVPATAFRNVSELVQKIDTLAAEKDQLPEHVGGDSGMPLLKYPPLTVFIDEVHAMARRSDDYLNMLEPKERRAVCGSKVCDFKQITFLAATTDKGKLPKPFLSRFRIIDLSPYTLEEASQIVALTFDQLGQTVSTELCESLAKVGRLVPRIAIEKVKEFCEVNGNQPRVFPLNMEGVRNAMSRLWNVDSNGLTLNDREYLEAVQSGSKGLQAIATILPCGKEEIETVIEPYLLQLNAIRLTNRGREITEIGRGMIR